MFKFLCKKEIENLENKLKNIYKFFGYNYVIGKLLGHNYVSKDNFDNKELKKIDMIC